jgi:hypothetical protein
MDPVSFQILLLLRVVCSWKITLADGASVLGPVEEVSVDQNDFVTVQHLKMVAYSALGIGSVTNPAIYLTAI